MACRLIGNARIEKEMTYRIHMTGCGDEGTLVFEGTLDRAALADLVGRCAAERRQSARVRVWLRAGTEVETGVLDELACLEGISLAAEAPFLARWIASCVKRG
jgi:hypothetical protein